MKWKAPFKTFFLKRFIWRELNLVGPLLRPPPISLQFFALYNDQLCSWIFDEKSTCPFTFVRKHDESHYAYLQ